MRPVNESPFLPQAKPSTLGGVVNWIGDITKQLFSMFAEYGRRLNNVYPKDGSENMEYVTLTSSVSAPASAASKAFIYVDSSDGDLKVKFKNGDIQVIATVSV